MRAEDHPNGELLRLVLMVAVPLWIERVRGYSISERLRRAGLAGQVIAEKGDVLQFGGGKRGAAAEAFNRLAEGLACLAFCPGGVSFLGEHWEASL